ncbi:hypothetical protein BJF79_13315 [Actinomadura sp. CNU-125]|nr:hypothetical protein BJF79_13315 [Actinomadura sp. CNU-125]
MVEGLGADVVLADVVAGPAGAEVVAAGGQFADEFGEVPVAGVAARLGLQEGDGVVGGAVPVAPEVAGAGIEEDEPGVVGHGAVRRLDHRGVQGAAEGVGGEDVAAAVHDDGGRVRHGVQYPLHGGPHPARGGAAPAAPSGTGGAGQVFEVRAFGVVEAEGAGDRVQDACGDTGQIAAFQTGVVLHADPGQLGDLGAAQPGDPPGAVGGQPGLLRGDLGPAGGQELADLAAVVHLSQVRRPAGGLGCPVGTPLGSAFCVAPEGWFGGSCTFRPAPVGIRELR